MMDAETIKGLKARAQAATPGPCLVRPEGPTDEIYLGTCLHCGEPDIWTIKVTVGTAAPSWFAGHYRGDLDEGCGAATALRPSRYEAAALWSRRVHGESDPAALLSLIAHVERLQATIAAAAQHLQAGIDGAPLAGIGDALRVLEGEA
jgi:hypothetical protein